MDSKIISLLLFSFFIGLKISVGQSSKPQLTKDSIFLQTEKKTILKADVIAPLFWEHIAISLERAIDTRQSIEVTFGWIGTGFKKYEKVSAPLFSSGEPELSIIGSGLSFAAGYKFFYERKKSNRHTHILTGIYIRPEVIFGFYNKRGDIIFTAKGKPILQNQKVNYQMILINVGWQKIFPGDLVFDVFVAAGYGRDNQPEIFPVEFGYGGINHRGLQKSNGGYSLGAKAGVKIGWNF